MRGVPGQASCPALGPRRDEERAASEQDPAGVNVGSQGRASRGLASLLALSQRVILPPWGTPTLPSPVAPGSRRGPFRAVTEPVAVHEGRAKPAPSLLLMLRCQVKPQAGRPGTPGSVCG